jgi:polyhydroxyalkanoate synthesis regulator phasin
MPQTVRPTSWKELFAKTAELGMGAIHLTRETGQKALNELVDKGHINQDDARKALTNLLAAGKKQKEHVEEMIAKSVDRALTKAEIARRKDVASLQRRIAQLEKAAAGSVKQTAAKAKKVVKTTATKAKKAAGRK